MGVKSKMSKAQNPVLYGYTGRQYDSESGLYYYRARYYNPYTSRFLSEDSANFLSEDENFYSYVSNMPTRLTDPTGNFGFAGFVGGALASFSGAIVNKCLNFGDVAGITVIGGILGAASEIAIEAAAVGTAGAVVISIVGSAVTQVLSYIGSGGRSGFSFLALAGGASGPLFSILPKLASIAGFASSLPALTRLSTSLGILYNSFAEAIGNGMHTSNNSGDCGCKNE